MTIVLLRSLIINHNLVNIGNHVLYSLDIFITIILNSDQRVESGKLLVITIVLNVTFILRKLGLK